MAPLVDDPVLTDTAVEEMLRWVSPIMQFQRTATRDTQLHGQRIGGGGPHFCLGSGLARLQVRTIFQELARRLPDIELADPVDHMGSTLVNAIRSMPVRFTPSKPVRLPPGGDECPPTTPHSRRTLTGDR